MIGVYMPRSDESGVRITQRVQQPFARLNRQAFGVRLSAFWVVDEQWFVNKKTDVPIGAITQLRIEKLPLLVFCIEPGAEQFTIDADQSPSAQINTETVGAKVLLPSFKHSFVNALTKPRIVSRLADIVIARKGGPTTGDALELFAREDNIIVHIRAVEGDVTAHHHEIGAGLRNVCQTSFPVVLEIGVTAAQMGVRDL